MAHYLMRFDDINPRMDWERFLKIKNILEKYKIKNQLSNALSNMAASSDLGLSADFSGAGSRAGLENSRRWEFPRKSVRNS